MSEETRTHRPPEAIEIAETISAAITLMRVWTHALQQVEHLYQSIEILDNYKAVLAVSDLRHALLRNPPQQALDILARHSELHQTMDMLDATASTTVRVLKPDLN